MLESLKTKAGKLREDKSEDSLLILSMKPEMESDGDRPGIGIGGLQMLVRMIFLLLRVISIERDSKDFSAKGERSCRILNGMGWRR